MYVTCCVDDRLQARDSSAVDIDVQHSPPGFVNEAYHYTVTVTNNEPTHITNVRYVVIKYFSAVVFVLLLLCFDSSSQSACCHRSIIDLYLFSPVLTRQPRPKVSACWLL